MTQAHLIIASALQGSTAKVNQAAQQVAQRKVPKSAIIAVNFYNTVIWPTISMAGSTSRDMAALLLGTAIAETGFRTTRQTGGGPALGYYQMEPDTHKDLWISWIIAGKRWTRRAEMISVGINSQFAHSTVDGSEFLNDLTTNHVYATLTAYYNYRRKNVTLPNRRNISAMANHWKTHHNTVKGKGTVKHFTGEWANTMGTYQLP